MLGRIHIGAPIVRGGLTLFPLWTEHEETEAWYLPGPDAESADLLSIAEAEEATASELVVTNRADKPVLLTEGETIAGGLQHRVLNVSVLLPADKESPIPVSCIEQGRWGRPSASRRHGRHSPLGLRHRKTASINIGDPAVQGEVWNSVAAFSSGIGACSPTSSLLQASEEAARAAEQLVEGLRPLPGQRGVVVGVGGAVRALELFDRAGTFAAYFDSLLAGYALEAGTARTEPTLASSARRFLRQVAGAPLARRPGTGLGEELAAATDALFATGIAQGEECVHLAAFTQA